MNLNKSRDFFDPDKFDDPIHIIGCGAVGSTIAENLTRLGVKNLIIWDFDSVEEHNIANQMFIPTQINKTKMDAVEELCKAINPDISITKKGKYEDDSLSGFVFTCPDSMKVRRNILTTNMGNPHIRGIFDGRMRLTDAQHFASDWTTPAKRQALLDTMRFTDAEAKDSTPVSACGTTLGVCFTVRILVGYMVANFVNYVLGKPLHKTVLFDLEAFTLDAFESK